MAKLSDDVYALSKLPKLDQATAFLNTNYGGALEFSTENMLVGKTGGPAFIKVKTAFGFVLTGKGVLAGHAFVVFRGIQLAYILAKGGFSDGSISAWVSLLMAKIAQFLGLGNTVKEGENLSQSSIRDLLGKLQVKANAMAKQALSHALVSGRAL